MALDRELEERWVSVKAQLSVFEKAFLWNHPVRMEPTNWADIYTFFANLYTQNDWGREHQMNDCSRKYQMYVYVRDYVRDLVSAQLAHLQKLDGLPLLAEYCRTWLATMKYGCRLKRLLHHLHCSWIRYYANTSKTDPVRPLDNLLMFYWREDLLSKLSKVITVAMQLVAADRMGHKVDHTIVRGFVDSLVIIGTADILPVDPLIVLPTEDPSESLQTDLSLYIRLFENEFLELARTFYREEGEKMVTVVDVSKFMRNVLARLAEEEERGKRFLHPDSATRLRRVTEGQLIGNHLSYLQKEAQGMICEGKVEDLRLVTTLLNKFENGIPPLRSFFVSYVRAQGYSLIIAHMEKMTSKHDSQSNLELMRLLVRLHRKHSNLVQRCFDGSCINMTAIDDAFRGFFANRPFDSLSLQFVIAHYIDNLLRFGTHFDREMWETTENIAEQRSQCKKFGDVIFTEGQDLEVLGEVRREMDQDKIRGQGAGPSEPKCKEKSGGKSKEEDIKHLSRYLTELVQILSYLDEKDLFLETNSRLFSQRLITHHDEDLEKLFISELRKQMGPFFTQRLGRMMQDKLVSNMTRDKFRIYRETKREQFRKLKKQREAENNPQSSRATLSCVSDCLQWPGISEGPDPHRHYTPVPSESVDMRSPSHGNGALTEYPNSGTEHEHTVSSLADAASMEALKLRNVAAPPSAGEEKSKVGDKKDVLREEKNGNLIIKGIDNMDVLEKTLQIDFGAHVLNALYWPLTKVADLNLPLALRACHQMFSEFYMENREMRKLSWNHNLSTVTMTASFGGRHYLLSLSASQAAALLLFNEHESITVSTACTSLNISKDELVENIKPLFLSRKCQMLRLEKREHTAMEEDESNEDNHGNKRGSDPGRGGNKRATDSNISCLDNGQLRKTYESIAQVESNMGKKEEEQTRLVEKECGSDTAGGDIADSGGTHWSTAKDINEGRHRVPNGDSEITIHAQDTLCLNTGFQSQAFRIWVPTSIENVTGVDVLASKRNVLLDCSTQVDAILVRIMKSKREMTHADLSAEVMSAFAPTFTPDNRLIKSRLERLIDQEYIERDANDPNMYRYSA